ncbi:hypothetical protein CEV32_2408 [Brucella rhizosphaerae]|uniref:Uncharacterized protein n=1 Tax=Brucella rhizosphaerae TaxID=571254 RepID=A0A256F6D2_9HYPH|nr:hypothetical protein CEV32_2408 [Brucella rhizosphaerae]
MLTSKEANDFCRNLGIAIMGDRVRLPCVLRSSAQSVEQHERWVASATS